MQKVMAMTDTKQGGRGYTSTSAIPSWRTSTRLGIQHAMNLDKMIETVLRGDYDRATTFGSGFGEFTDYDAAGAGLRHR